MENLTNSADEVLVDSLSFKLPASGNYVVERRSVTFLAEGSNVYSPDSGVKIMRFKLNGENWADPSTFRVMFDVVNDQNDGVKKIRPIGRPHAFFNRLRISARGQVLEDIDNFNRVSEMFHILQTPASRVNDAIEAFGVDPYFQSGTLTETTAKGFIDMQTVMFKPLCGILQQTKYIPLRYCPLEFELELTTRDEPIFTSADGPLTAANTSDYWHLQNCMVKVDVCTLDNALDNSYVNHLLSGKSLNMVYNTFISSIQTLVSADSQVNMSRSLSKMKSVFMTLVKNDMLAGDGTEHFRLFNCFASPMAANTVHAELTHDQSLEVQKLQLQIGSKIIPEYPIRSHAEAFYSLRKALGVQANSLHSIDIDGHQYRTGRFIVGFDTEKLLGLSFTGTNTRNSLMTMHLKLNAAVPAMNRMHITLLAEQIVEISDTGVQVYD